MGTKHLTRKEIVREDKIHWALAGTYDWFSNNARLVLIAVGVVAVGLGGAFLWQYLSRSNSAKLQIQYGEALEMFSTPVGAAAQPAPDVTPSRYKFATTAERNQKSLAEFQKIAEDSPRSDVGQYAKYYVALIQHQQGQTAQAKKQLEELIADGRQPMIRNLARNLLAQISEGEKNNQQTVTLLKQILDDATPGFPKQNVLMRLGQSYEALGAKDEAVKQYKRIVTEYPNSQESAEAQTKLDALQKQASK